MKKLLVIGIALIAACMFAMPAAAATEWKLGGYFMVQGRIQDNPSLNEDTDDGGAHWRMRWRFTPQLVVSDNLSFNFKWDAFDGTGFGTFKNKTSTAKENAGTYIDMDRAWMTIKASFGTFQLGRMPGGAWGLTFGDDNEDYDRVRFDTKFGNVTTGIILQKNVEADWTANGQVDADSDTYYLYGVYKADFGSVGLLGAFTNGKNTTTIDVTKYNLLPYFDVKFGNFGLRGELIWATGEQDPDAVGAKTTDIDELAWNLEADFSFGAFTLTGGYAWVQGDGSGTDTKAEEANATYGGIGDDWDIFVVLMDLDQFINGHAYGTFPAGVKLAYGMFDWKARKDLSFRVAVGFAEAEELGRYPVGTDKKMGTEYGFHAKWDIMKNLYWALHFGYLDAGDFWKKANGITNLDNTWTAYHDVRLNF